MANKNLLDVDPSILEKNLLITGNQETELNALFPKTEEVKSTLTKPTPGFCIKIRSNDEQKVFINVCHTDAIPPPEDISEEQLIEILQSETRSNYRVPMSIGQGRTIADKSGNPALAYDVAIHKDFLTKLEKVRIFKEFFITVTFEALEDKYNISLNRNEFSILKNKKCMGTLQLHRIQQREVNNRLDGPKKKLIEEMDNDPAGFKEAIAKKTGNLNQQLRLPDYRLIRKPPAGDIECIIGEFKMPEVVSADDVILDIGEDRLILQARRQGYVCDLFLPHNIDQDAVQAHLNKSNGILTVTMPVTTCSA